VRQRSKRAKSYRWSPRTIVQNSHSREPCVTDRTMKSDSSSRLGVAKTHPGWRREFGNSTSPRSRSDTSEQLAYRVRQQQLTADFGLFAFKTHDIPTLLHEATRACAEGLQAKLSKVLEYLHAEGTFRSRRHRLGFRGGRPRSRERRHRQSKRLCISQWRINGIACTVQTPHRT
jgi:hypothetical protein